VLRSWDVPSDAIFGDAGDLNGDGVSECVVQNAVYTANLAGPLFTFSTPGIGSGPVQHAGDFNGDGQADFALAMPFQTQPRLSVYSGLDGAIISTLFGSSGSQLGSSIAGNGDFNGDGLVDVAVGAPGQIAGTALDAGRVRVISGSASPPTGYCMGKVNSAGCLPFAWASGVPSLSGPDTFTVHAGRVLSNKSGILFWGRQPNSVPFVGGTLCVSAPFVRSAILNSGGTPSVTDCTGHFSYPFTQQYMQQNQLGVGSTAYCQFWFRDPGFAPPSNVGLTDAVRFAVTF
jgi:hypothetical protein